jgi:prevent-host-death family protein
MKNTYSIALGQREFPRMVRRAEQGGLAVVTRHEKPVAYVISAERLEGLLETVELLADPGFVAAHRAEKRRGRRKMFRIDDIPD